MSKHYGIRYPFTTQDDENYFLDVNHDLKEKVKSDLMHVIFTPKGQKLRDPEFGTDLIKYIFAPNEGETWGSIKSDIAEVIKKYVRGVTLNDISVLQSEGGIHEVFVRIDYSISNGFKTITDSIVTKL